MNLEILKIASNTENHKIVNKHTHRSKHKNPICGDIMEITLKITKNKVIDFGYQCKSCIYCQASVSLLSRKVKNKSVNSIIELLNIVNTFFVNKNLKFPKRWSIFTKLFNEKNLSRKECILLPFETLSKALKHYQNE